MTFVDSSALVAAVLPEQDGQYYADRIGEAHQPLSSSLVVYETTLALVRSRRVSVPDSMMIVLDFLQRGGVELMPISADAHVLALGAHARYGKGTGHPAQLNMGDCFSYALAKQAGVKLLYKGDDFARTDLA